MSSMIRVDICDSVNGWYSVRTFVPAHIIESCYALPKEKCRAEHLLQTKTVRPYTALIWQVEH